MMILTERERQIIYNKEYRLKNKEKKRLDAKKYYDKNKKDSKFIENHKIARKKHRIKIKDDPKFKEEARIRTHYWYLKNKNTLEYKEKRRIYSKEYCLKNKDNPIFREKNRLNIKKYRNKTILNAFNILGGFKCSNPNCVHPTGEIHPKLLEIDHIHGGGTRERKNGLTASKKYLEIINNSESAKRKYQVLCVACNRIKIEENNECNNKRKKPSSGKITHQYAIISLGGRCTDPNCVFTEGCSDIRILDIHHINKDGAEERRERQNNKIHLKIIKDPNKAKLEYTILCLYCHSFIHIKS